ncbi:hypothetical protein EKE94_05055 [Mesobaculum littorinae]|uniref:FHA domain-containing protein n=1 Tax=Mesobaculum littorinae TaxID=2486419 RepID=A0A438AHV4_9RHOB|nr:hypothetical protein [Mesobaculum littorinae]RVV98301.1 hypothetical protein EKE94_05055 [Mesobaculum littorinae]
MTALTLTLRSGAAAGAARMTDGSRPFSVGTAPGCTWTLPPDDGAALPSEPASIAIRRSGDRFVVEGSGMVEIGGHPLQDGAEVPLHHGSDLVIGAHRLSVHVSQSSTGDDAGRGPTDAFFDAHQPTISAILSDVSPGGDGASGPLPGRTGEEWLDSLTSTGPGSSRSSRPDWDRLGRFGAATGPEQGGVPRADNPLPPRGAHPAPRTDTPLPDALGPDPLGPAPREPDPLAARPSGTDPLGSSRGQLLPDDWNAPVSDTGNRIAQGAANRQSVSFGDPAPQEPAARRTGPDARLLREALGLYEGEIDAPDATQLANAGTALATSLGGLAEIERALSRALADLNVPQPLPAAMDHATLDPGSLLSDHRGDTCLALSRRVQAIVARQTALIDSLQADLAAAREMFDPETIRAAVASRGGAAARLSPARAAWDEYCRRRTAEDAPLTPAALRRQLAARIDDQPEDP